jgi:Tol biopolymer transport system component
MFSKVLLVAALAGVAAVTTAAARPAAAPSPLERLYADNGFPAWSPDGTKVAFASTRTGGDLFVANADGTHARRLTSGGGDEIAPRWSPDGS